MNPDMPKGYSLKLKDVTFRFDGRAPLFEYLDLDIRAGQFVAICGKSGVGKTSLLRLIAGLQSPNSGEIFYDNVYHIGVPMGVAKVSQDYSKSLLPWFTIEKNIALAISSRKYSHSEQHSIIQSSLDFVGLNDVAKYRPRELSGGMQQRVCIARAIAMKPKLLLLDEPFASLDSFTKNDLEDLVLHVTSELKATTILVSHDIDQAIYLSDRIITLSGSPAKIGIDIEVRLKKPRHQISTRAEADFQAHRKKIFDELGRNST